MTVSLKNDPRPIEQVPASIIRRFFNEGQFYQSAINGDLTTVLRPGGSRHLKKLPENIPYCSHSQIIVYLDADGETVALAHQYLLPDGSIGASGLPDPKLLFLPERILQHKKELDSEDD
jgi:hypothetical protein